MRKSDYMVFSPDQLRAMTDTLVALPGDHRSALVGSNDVTGAQAVATFQLAKGDGNFWYITSAGRHEWAPGQPFGYKGMSVLWSA